MKKNQKGRPKKNKVMLQMQKEIYSKCLEEDLAYLKNLGDRLFEMKFTDVIKKKPI